MSREINFAGSQFVAAQVRDCQKAPKVPQSDLRCRFGKAASEPWRPTSSGSLGRRGYRQCLPFGMVDMLVWQKHAQTAQERKSDERQE
jgi:hypothetical protein